MAGTQTNRTAIDLPVDISNEIIAKAQEASAIMSLARKVNLPGRGLAIPVITADPEAEWVAETGKKPVKNPGLNTKILRAYKLAVIVPFSKEFKRDLNGLYNELVRRLPNALGKKFDYTVFGGEQAPGSDFDTFTGITAQALGTDAYGALVDAQTDIAIHGGILNGFAISPQAQGILLASRDETGRPLFINNVAEGAVPVVLGAKTKVTKGAFVSGSPALVGVAGDWEQAIYGVVNGVEVSISEEATLELGDGSTINLWQQNMFAVRAEIEIGFRADTTVFNALTAENVPSA